MVQAAIEQELINRKIDYVLETTQVNPEKVDGESFKSNKLEFQVFPRYLPVIVPANSYNGKEVFS